MVNKREIIYEHIVIITPSEQDMKNKDWLKQLKQKIDQATQNAATTQTGNPN